MDFCRWNKINEAVVWFRNHCRYNSFTNDKFRFTVDKFRFTVDKIDFTNDIFNFTSDIPIFIVVN